MGLTLASTNLVHRFRELVRQRIRSRCLSCCDRTEKLLDELRGLPELKVLVHATDDCESNIQSTVSFMSRQLPSAAIRVLDSKRQPELSGSQPRLQQCLSDTQRRHDLAIHCGVCVPGLWRNLRDLIKYALLTRHIQPAQAKVYFYFCGAFAEHPSCCLILCAVNRWWRTCFYCLAGMMAHVAGAFLLSWSYLRKVPPTKTESILVVANGGIGDLVMSSPALRAIRATFPKAHIVCLTPSPYGEEMFRHCHYVDEIYMRERKGGILEHLLVATRLAPYRFALSIQIGRPLYMLEAYISYIAGVRRRYGIPTVPRPPLFRPLSHEFTIRAQNYRDEQLELLRAVGIEASERRTECYIGDEARQTVRRLILGHDTRPLVVIHPGCSPGVGAEAKQWPAAYHAELIHYLGVAGTVRVVLTGSEREKGLVYAIAAACGNAAEVLVGKLTVQELLALLELAELVVTNDTGPLHAAIALSTPVVAVFGPSDPAKILAADSITERCRVLRAPTACPPKRDCPVYARSTTWRRDLLDAYCMIPYGVCTDAISVSSVLAAIQDMDIPALRYLGESGDLCNE